jgi:hypothetical protein
MSEVVRPTALLAVETFLVLVKATTRQQLGSLFRQLMS